MTFQPVYYSQQDLQWKGEIVGFGEPGDTLGYVGCALTCTAMLLSGHGLPESPGSLNEKLKSIGGFAGGAIRWESLSRLYPQVTLKSNISCVDTDAPLSQIDASIAAGQPVIVMMDSSPAAGLLTHCVLLYAREKDDYLMLDPWPHKTHGKKKMHLTPRYSQGNPLRRSIMHVIVYECPPAAGATVPSSVIHAAGRAKRGGFHARVRAEATWGVNIRSGIDTSSMENILAAAPAGTLLTLLETDGRSKVGAVNEWVRVRDEKGNEGFCAAWHLERAEAAAAPSASKARPVTGPAREATVLSKTAARRGDLKLIVVVKTGGAKVFKAESARSGVLAREKAGANLLVVEPLEEAIKKIGLGGRWLTVKATNGERGFIDAGSIKEG